MKTNKELIMELEKNFLSFDIPAEKRLRLYEVYGDIIRENNFNPDWRTSTELNQRLKEILGVLVKGN